MFDLSTRSLLNKTFLADGIFSLIAGSALLAAAQPLAAVVSPALSPAVIMALGAGLLVWGRLPPRHGQKRRAERPRNTDQHHRRHPVAGRKPRHSCVCLFRLDGRRNGADRRCHGRCRRLPLLQDAGRVSGAAAPGRMNG
ncbi:hypothetical protein Q1M63_18855 [Sinorhizobium meliloti]|nr:hypothetical protein Q1M63_18855 [Sinorhizobium meliloti]